MIVSILAGLLSAIVSLSAPSPDGLNAGGPSAPATSAGLNAGGPSAPATDGLNAGGPS